ncbi:bifunctional Protein kinase domain/Protein kinase-like domain superfamily/Serine-threonine-protein kinase [Babesia duncani]|uniref:Bifunctional Protein kinase domain/Protein kinase-like domain superfamily/Serine-threonine-protein kinase n=1 Tax=Babesia duncani TaxID=323732 RepID=A0AAD9PLZ5_9APIC|nr:bifunctional Protein kinase domain/Protein kinase-like domain superfamily/Serine-threonine-protein kinase [Babesia duncani]
MGYLNHRHYSRRRHRTRSRDRYNSRDRSRYRRGYRHRSRSRSRSYRRRNKYRYSSESRKRYRRHYSRESHRYRSRDHRKEYKRRDKSPEDKIIHFSWTKGMSIGKYTAIKRISDGTFGRVLLCEYEDKEFAIKVVRDVEKYTSSAKIEAEILTDIKTSDAQGESHCVILKDQFMFKDRNMCLVFENLGPSLYSFLEANEFKGFFIADIQKIAYQVLKGLAFLRQCKVVHTDLKPENILLTCAADQYIEVPFPRSTTGMMTKRPVDANVKIIDFGSAIYEDEYHSSIINTRQYRSPEVILDIGWSYPSDLWSLGCILVEIYTGHLLFRTHSHLEHLAMMVSCKIFSFILKEKIIGKFPPEMLERAKESNGRRYLNSTGTGIDFTSHASRSSIERVEACQTISELIRPEHRAFADLIRSILKLDPSQRPTPQEAMQHEFFALKIPED